MACILLGKRWFFGKFQFNDFYLLIVHYHIAKFEKNLWEGPEILAYKMLGVQPDICPKKGFLGKFHLSDFLSI